MTVIPFPPASARPKPGKEPPAVSAQIMVLPVIRIERDQTGLYAEIDQACCELNLSRHSRAAEHLRFLVADARGPFAAGSD